MEQPWQQTKAAILEKDNEELWDNITNTLCNLDFIQAKAAAKMTYDLVYDFNEVLEVIPDNQKNIEEEKVRQARMDKYTLDLIACAKGEITIDELEIPESITPWTKEQIDAEIERIKTNPTNADKLKDFLNFLGQEAENLQKYANELPNFAIQQAWNFANEGFVGKAAENYKPQIYKSLLINTQYMRLQWTPLPQIIQKINSNTKIVNAVAIFPNGKLAITGSEDNTCILWNLETGAIIHILEGHTKNIASIAITPNGQYAISGSEDNTCILWDLNKGNLIKTLLGHKGRVNSVAITADGQKAISGSEDNTCILWDLNKGNLINTLLGHKGSVNSLSITADGQKAISGSDDNTCIVWDLKKCKSIKILKGHTNSIGIISFTPDGKRAVSGSWDNTCVFWDIKTGKRIRTLRGHTSNINALAITPDGQKVISGSDDCSCRFWDLKTGKLISTFTEHTDKITDISITPDAQKAISSSIDLNCIIWDLNKSKLKKNTNMNDLYKVSITPNGKRALSCSYWSYECIFWNLSSGNIIKKIKGFNESISSIAITPDGKRAIISLLSNICMFWDLNNSKILHNFNGHNNISTFSISSDSKKVITSSLDSCILWDLKKGKLIYIIKYSAEKIFITPDFQRAILQSYNECLLWNLNTGEVIQKLEGHTDSITSIAITPDGQKAITSSLDKSCKVWDLNRGKLLHSFEGHSDWVLDIAITPDGKRAISTSVNRCILWNIITGKPIEILKGQNSIVYTVSITPEGKRAITGSVDKTCILWDLKKNKKLALTYIESRFKIKKLFNERLIFLPLSRGHGFSSENKHLLISNKSIVTIRSIWDHELQTYLELSSDCPLCGHRFAIPASVLDTIEKIKREADLKPEQSACLELPDKAWEEPGLKWFCPECGEELRFNPFIAGGD